MGLLDSAVQSVLGAVGISLESQVPAPPAPDFEAFNIYEIVDGRERKPGEDGYGVVFAGSFLPHQPFEFGGTQQIVKDYYPGADEPSIQVLGSRENDVTIRGRFYLKRVNKLDVYAGNELINSKKAAESYQRQCDQIRMRGNLLKLELGEWVRWGFLEEVKFTMKRLVDIEYELKFVISGFYRPTNCKFTDNKSDTVASANKDLNNAIAALLKQRNNYPSSMPRTIAGFLDDQIGAVANVVATVTGYVDGVIGDVQAISNSANRAVGMIKYAKSYVSKTSRNVGAIVTSVGNLGSEVSSSVSGFGAAFRSDAYKSKAQITNAKAINDTKYALFDIQVYLRLLLNQYSVLVSTTPVGRHFVQQGDTLQKISIKFYGSQDRWNDIYKQNKLTSTTLTPGSILEIPK